MEILLQISILPLSLVWSRKFYAPPPNYPYFKLKKRSINIKLYNTTSKVNGKPVGITLLTKYQHLNSSIKQLKFDGYPVQLAEIGCTPGLIKKNNKAVA